MVGRVLGVMVAGTLLAAAPASAAELQAAYDYYGPARAVRSGSSTRRRAPRWRCRRA